MVNRQFMDMLGEEKIIGILRGFEAEKTRKLIEIYKKEGIKFIEVTFNSPEALKIISEYADKSDIYIGMGTVKNLEELKKALESGAQFIVTPNYNSEVVKTAKRRGVPIISGAYTPSEIYDAYRDGANAVKLFPASIPGPDYLKSIRGPIPEVDIIPTGGIDENNISDFLKAGAFAFGIGGGLVDKESVKNEDWEKERKKVRKLMSKLK